MTYSAWISKTASEKGQRQTVDPTPTKKPGWMNRAARKQVSLKEVDDALWSYEEAPSRENLNALKGALEAWGESDAFKQMQNNQGRWTAIEGAIQEMYDWTQRVDRVWTRVEYSPVLTDFSLAAQTLINRFPMMPYVYKSALHETFIDSSLSSKEIYCLKWYRDDAEWTKRLNELGDNSEIAQQSTALTVAWERNHLCRTEHQFLHAPYNRGIEFHQADKGSFTHELLHWCTNEDFKNYIETRYELRSREYNFLKEGLTEWLKRFATGDRSTGGYQNAYEDTVEVAQLTGINELELARTYLAGYGIEEMCDELVKTYNRLLLERAVGKARPSESTYNKDQYDELLNSITRGIGSMRSPKNYDTDARTKTLYNGFLAERLTRENIKDIANAAWANGFTKWKAERGL